MEDKTKNSPVKNIFASLFSSGAAAGGATAGGAAIGGPQMMAISAGVSLLSGLFGARRRRRQQRAAQKRYEEMNFLFYLRL